MKLTGKILVNKRTGEWVELEEMHGEITPASEYVSVGMSLTYTAKTELPASFKHCSREDLEVRDFIPPTLDEQLKTIFTSSQPDIKGE